MLFMIPATSRTVYVARHFAGNLLHYYIVLATLLHCRHFNLPALPAMPIPSRDELGPAVQVDALPCCARVDDHGRTVRASAVKTVVA